MPNDHDLVLATLKGDAAAFRDLVTRYEGRIYRLAVRILRDPQDAEDVLQETFINAYRHLDSFRGDSTFSTWIYRIATNASLMKLRARKPMASLDGATTDGIESEAPPLIVDWAATPEEMLLNDETRRQMQAALDELPDTLRTVFILRDVEGLSTEETARALDIGVPNVKTRLHRARLALRDKLSVYFSDRMARAGKETI